MTMSTLPSPSLNLQAALRLALARDAAIVAERERAADAELGEPLTMHPHGQGFRTDLDRPRRQI